MNCQVTETVSCLGDLGFPLNTRRAGEEFIQYMNGIFGRVSGLVPTGVSGRYQPLVRRFAELSKEFGESLQTFAETMDDNEVSRKEAAANYNELKDLLQVVVGLMAYFKNLHERGRKLC